MAADIGLVHGCGGAGEDDLARARTLFARILSALPAGASVSASDPRDDEGDRDPAVDDERDGVR